MSTPDPFYKSKEWLILRARCLKRDGYRCVFCGRDVRGKGLSRVDHIKPRKLRPDLALVLDNLRTLCGPCDNKRHVEKGGRNPEPVNAEGYPKDWQ